MNERPYRIISGPCYPNVFEGGEQPKRVMASMEDENDQSFYHDPAVRLTREDVKKFIGKPIREEHDPEGGDWGLITDAWVDGGHMWMTARIYTDSPEGEALYERINRGDTSGLSVGYGIYPNENNEVEGKFFTEISVCKEPFFTGAGVRVAAANKGAYKNNSEVGRIFLRIMASEVPVDQSNKEASSVLKQHDQVLKEKDDIIKKSEEMAQELARMRAEKKALEEQNALYAQEEEQRRLAYAESNKGMIKDVLEMALENVREVNGPDATLSEDYVKSITNGFSAPEAQKVMEPIVASVMAWKKKKAEAPIQASKLEEMEKRIAELQKAHEDEAVKVEAHRQRMALLGESSPEPAAAPKTVQASRLTVEDLWIPVKEPSKMEADLYQANYGRPITASARKPVEDLFLPALPRGIRALENSPRYSKEGRPLLCHLNKHLNSGLNSVVVPGIAVKVEHDPK